MTRPVNARVVFRDDGGQKEFKSVTVDLNNVGWIVFTDEYGKSTAYPSDVVWSVDADFASFCRGS